MMNKDTETSSRFPNWGNIAIVLGVALLYFIAARLSLHLAFKNTNASPVWPPSGIAFAAILLLGKRIWPGILLGAFAANVVVFTVNQAAGFDDIIMMSAAIAVGNTLEALVGYRLIAIAKIDPLLGRTRDVFRFVVIAVGMCLLSCTIGVTALAFGRVAPWSAYSTIWFTWWLGDVVGVIIQIGRAHV